MNLRSPSIIAAIGLASIASSQAAVLIYEPFDIADPGDNLVGKTTGTGLSGNWNNSDSGTRMEVGDGSLTFGNLQTSVGNHAKIKGTEIARTGVTASLGTTLSDAGVMDHGATLWFSFITAAPNTSANNRMHFYLGTDGSNAGGNSVFNSGSAFGVQIDRATQLRGLSANGGTITNTANTNNMTNDPTLIIGRIIWGADATANDTIDLFLSPTDVTLFDPSSTPLVTHTAVVDQSTFTLLAISGKERHPVIDEIRFGTTALSVLPIPEPSSLVLLGLSSLALLRRRR